MSFPIPALAASQTPEEMPMTKYHQAGISAVAGAPENALVYEPAEALVAVVAVLIAVASGVWFKVT